MRVFVVVFELVSTVRVCVSADCVALLVKLSFVFRVSVLRFSDCTVRFERFFGFRRVDEQAQQATSERQQRSSSSNNDNE